MTRFLTSYIFVVTVFASGLIFGIGFGNDREFAKDAVRIAYNLGHEKGAESVILAAIQE